MTADDIIKELSKNGTVIPLARLRALISAGLAAVEGWDAWYAKSWPNIYPSERPSPYRVVWDDAVKKAGVSKA